MTVFIEEGRAGSLHRPALTTRFACVLLLALAALAALPYLRSFTLPPISDDYLQVELGRKYGPVSGWAALSNDALYRCRATSIVLTWWTEQWFGVSQPAFTATSIGLHILNTSLIFAFGRWRRIGWNVSFIAAAFFAVNLGHQEAVIWYSALPELLMFLFGVAALHAWLNYLQRNSLAWCGASFVLFALSLLSKESAVIFGPLLALITWAETGSFRKMLPLTAFAAVTAIYVAGIFSAQKDHLHFNDGTFSLKAPFWLVWSVSLSRLLWVWGFAALLVLTAWREWRHWGRVALVGLTWIALTLFPYCFLTYMPRIPSRHTYLAGAGLGVLVAAGFLALAERTASRRWIGPAVAAVILVHNIGYVAFVKHPQYVKRAEPTEILLEFARQVKGPIHIHCFPYGIFAAEMTLKIGMGPDAPALVRDDNPAPTEPVVFCLGDRQHRAQVRPAVLEPERVSVMNRGL